MRSNREFIQGESVARQQTQQNLISTVPSNYAVASQTTPREYIKKKNRGTFKAVKSARKIKQGNEIQARNLEKCDPSSRRSNTLDEIRW